MSAESTIIVKWEDRYSDAVKAMAAATKPLSKDVEELQGQLDRLGKNKVILQMDAQKARSELRELKKQFAATGEEADGLNVQLAQQNYDNIQRNLRLVTEGARDVEKQMASTAETARKTGNGGWGGMTDTLKKLSAAGFRQMAVQTALQGATSLVASAMGSETGGILSSMISSTASGFSIGMASGHPVAGAALGAGIGLANGVLQNVGAETEAFKSYYSGQYTSALTARSGELESGSALAAQREKDKNSFAAIFKDEEAKEAGAAETFLNSLVDTANATPFLYDDLTAMSKTLATYGYGSKEIIPVLTKVGDAGAALGMSTADMTMAATALGRMKSSDKTTLEYLNILNDRGIGVIGILADALSKQEGKAVSQGEVYERISKGEIGGRWASEAILTAMEELYKGSMHEQSLTYEGRTSTLLGNKQEIENALGAAYNERALAGLNADVEAYGGTLGEALKKANALVGDGRAIADNLSKQYQREALEAVYTGKDTTVYDGESAQRLRELGQEFQTLQAEYDGASDERKAEIAARLEDVRSETEALAESAYNASDTAVALMDSEIDLLGQIRDNTAMLGDAAWNGDRRLEVEGSKGLASRALGSGFRGSDSTGAGYVWGVDLSSFSKNAYGLDRVPYDGYPAVLHQGERVLTAQQARRADREGGAVSVQIGSVSFGAAVTDPEEAAETFARALQRAILLARPD